jgi:ribosomal protein L44E
MYQTDRGKKVQARAHKNRRLKSPERVSARDIAKKIPLEGMCVVCGVKPAEHRHHDDYNKPMEVRLVCQECHQKIHGGEEVVT